MADIPKHIQIKLRESRKYARQIKKLCLKDASFPKATRRREISVHMGTMAGLLRSALNNALWDFAENKLKALLDNAEYENLRWSHDFPIEQTEEQFKNSRVRILRHIADHALNVYELIETVQSYHTGNEYLWNLKRLSNDTTHSIPIETQVKHGNAITFAGWSPYIRSDQVILPIPGRRSKVYPSIPCYVEEAKLFVSRKKKWILFLVDFGTERKTNVMAFIETSNRGVQDLISRFYALW